MQHPLISRVFECWPMSGCFLAPGTFIDASSLLKWSRFFHMPVKQNALFGMVCCLDRKHVGCFKFQACII